MSYPGNPSLASDLQQRILTTFEQTLELAAEGSRQEALLGCDFVLRMDPQFQSARLLQDRLRATTGAVQIDDLRPGAAAPAAPQPQDNPFALDALDGGFDLELPDLPDSDLLGATAPAFGPDGLRQEYQSLLDQRRFQELMTRAEREMEAIAADPELQRIAGAAQERMEAEPYIRKFLTSAREALRKGETHEAERLLGKARSLDASHPELAELEALQSGPAPASPAPATPSFTEPAFTLEPQESPFARPVDLFGDAGSFGSGGSGGGSGLGDSETDRRIRELLAEGQTAFDAADPQGAIDAWSRIFLIDIDHQEAARRIEMARKLKAENERQVEEIFHDGLAAIEGNDLPAARRELARVLELQPGHVAAREYLQQLDAGTVPVVKPAAARDLAGVSPEPALPLLSDLEGGLAEELKEEILVPPDPSEVAARATRRDTKAAAPKEKRASRMFLMVGAPVLLLALIGGWFLWQNREKVFPNSQDEEMAAPAPAGDNPVVRANELHRTGKTARAIALLQRTPPGSPHYKESQALLARLQAATKPAAAQPAGPAPAVLQRREALLQAARQAYSERSYLRAVERFEQAAALVALEGQDSASLAHARGQIEPLTQQIEFFRAHDWERILPELWRLREADPGNPDVNRLLVDSYYNLAVRDLQRNDALKAAEKLEEAASLAKDDPMLQRHLVFAQTYQERPKDLLYRIYVKHLPIR
jgi:tetratricopeptide (TPR) repeat protein